MKDEAMRYFQRRLGQCNKGEMIVIMYDIVFAYMDEAKEEHDKGNYEDYKSAVKQSQKAIEMLMDGLDFSYDISKELFRLYVTSRNLLAKAIYQNKPDGIYEAERILRNLYTAFCEAAKQDTSGPIMQNSQKVYAGMTYGKTELNESLSNDYNRGFLV